MCPLLSPFQPVLEGYRDHLPPTLAAQYLLPADGTYQLLFEGSMDRVWHSPSWLRPLFWLLTWGDMLFPETGEQVPASMVISGGRLADGSPYQLWCRTFHFKRRRYFNARMEYDPATQRVIEWLGPGNRLCVFWDVRFHPPATIEIASERVALRLGRRRLPLPRWLAPRVGVIEQADLRRENGIHVRLTLSHPLLGAIFGYEGSFLARRLPSSEGDGRAHQVS